MTEQDTFIKQESFMNRIGRFFRRSRNGHENGNGDSNALMVQTRPVSGFWGSKNAAIAQVQEGVASLTELMTAIRQNMDNQGRRQDDLLAHLSALPKVLETIPENNRIQGETLKAIHEQLLHQAEQQHMLGEILEKMSESGGDQKELLEGIRERVETLNHQDKAMADSLNSVGSALEQVSRSSSASTQVLENMRDNIRSRDTDLEKVLQRQSARFTTMLSIAIFLSIAALVAVVVMGYLVMHAGGR